MLSVIICTYNREKYIYNVLRSIAENNFPYADYEIVLVNNNSTDRTQAECERFQKDFPDVRFRYVVETRQGLSHARNKGIEESRGDILIYVDDDATVNKKYLQAYSDFFRLNPLAWAAGGPVIPAYETEEPDWFSPYTKPLITGYLYYGNKIKPFSRGKYPCGASSAYRKEVFETIGLFNTELGRKGENLAGAEEKDIFDKMTRAGMIFYYLPQAVLYHVISEKKLTEEYFDQLTYSIGKSERMRTKSISAGKYRKRIISECVKWVASIALLLGYTLRRQPKKGWKLILFRRNVTKGLFGY